MTCSDCIHYLFMGHDSRCDVRPAHSPGFLNPACDKFEAGDSRKERSDYLAGLPPVVIKKQPERFSNKQAKKHMEEKNTTPVQAPAQQTKVCKRCGRDLPASEFNTHKNTKDGLQPYCRKCQSDMAREARERKKEDAPKEDPGTPTVWDDIALVAELRRRGYEVKCTKTVTVEL